MLSREYVKFLESLPCNRAARRRSQRHGQWLAGWVPEPRNKDFCEPMQEAFVQKDAPHGVMGRLGRLTQM